MRKKAVRRLLMAMAVATTVANTAPSVSVAAENEEPQEEGEQTGSEEQEGGSEETSDNMTVTETQNEDGSTTTTYEYTEEIQAGSLAEAVEKAQEKTEEQEQIKADIEAAGGTYEYTVEIEDNSTTEEVTDQYDTLEEAETAAKEVNGIVTEVEGETVEGESASQAGFESEEAAQEWADQKAEELVESQTGDSSEKVITQTNISQVEGTGITVEETKDIEEQTFDTEEEAIEYAESFNNPDYTITPVNGKWVYEKMEVTAEDENGDTIHFDTQEEAQQYIEENQVEGAFLESIDIVDTDTEEVKETVVITATSYEDFVAKVEALYAEAEANENISIAETKEEVLENYKTSINFEELTEEQKKELMEEMQEDAADQNYTYEHLDLQTAAKMNVYDDKGNATEVDCSIKDDETLKVRVFTEIGGKMTEITMNTRIEKDPQGYWEIRSEDKDLDLSKCFVLIEGTLEYKLNGETKTAPFSTTGYLNNDYNTCSQKPGQSSNRPGHRPSVSTSGGYDIVLDDFTMNSEGKVTVESTATKVYTITVTKTTTKYVVKYEVDDPSTGVYEEDYQVNGTYVEETVIPPEYMAEVTSQLTDILYDVNYTKTNQDFTVIVDGNGQVTVVPEEPEVPDNPIVPDNPVVPDTPNRPSKDDSDDTPTTTSRVIVEIPVTSELQPITPPVVNVPDETPEPEVPDTSVTVPRTGENTMAESMAWGGTIFSGLAAMFMALPLLRKKRD